MPGSVLFVEDDTAIFSLVQRGFEARGFSVTFAENGVEALARLADRPAPDVIVTDVNMPLLNGFELLRRIRSDRRVARVPVIVLSARTETTDIVAGYQYGADDYVPKPFDISVLITKVEMLLRRTRAAGAAAPIQRRGKVIMFLRCKGGVGTTSLAVNTATALASLHCTSVGLIDLALQSGTAALMFNLQPRHTIADIAAIPPSDLDADAFAQCLLIHQSGVRVLAAPHLPEKAELVTLPVVQNAIDSMRRICDYVVLDAPFGFPPRNVAALDMSDLVCVVMSPHLADFNGTKDCFDVLGKLGIGRDKVVLAFNRLTARGLSNDDLRRFVGRSADVVVPYAELFSDAADQGKPLFLHHRDNPAATAILELAELCVRRLGPTQPAASV